MTWKGLSGSHGSTFAGSAWTVDAIVRSPAAAPAADMVLNCRRFMQWWHMFWLLVETGVTACRNGQQGSSFEHC